MGNYIPQIIIIALYTLNVGTDLIQHGKPKTGYHNFFITFVGAGIGIAILRWGGFFN